MFVNSQNILLDDPNNRQWVFIKVFFYVLLLMRGQVVKPYFFAPCVCVRVSVCEQEKLWFARYVDNILSWTSYFFYKLGIMTDSLLPIAIDSRDCPIGRLQGPESRIQASSRKSTSLQTMISPLLSGVMMTISQLLQAFTWGDQKWGDHPKHPAEGVCCMPHICSPQHQWHLSSFPWSQYIVLSIMCCAPSQNESLTWPP